MERHDDDLTTAEPDNLPASADTVEPEWREQADAGAESELRARASGQPTLRWVTFFRIARE